MAKDSTAPIASGPLERAVDWVFGYDYFISHGHDDGLTFPATEFVA